MDIKELIRKMNVKHVIVFIAIMALTSLGLNAQNFSYEVKCIENEMPINDFDTLYSHQCILMLNDTLNVDSIKVQIGDVYQASNLLDQTFGYDQTTFLPANLAYYRRGSEIILELGNYLKGNFYYGVSIIDTSGIESSIIPWDNQTP